MIKKWCCVLLLVSLFAGMSVYAQNAAAVLPVHVRTAQRYADLAINYYGAEEYEGAISYAEMALSYNAGCSDALYVRGLAAREMNEPRGIVLAWFEKALESNTFSNYARDTVRTAIAADYVEQLRYEDAAALLDAEPRLLTADAQYYRAICLYGTVRASDARDLISSTWRMYPRDWRFPRLFFTTDDPSDPAAAALAGRLIANIKNWNDAHPELNLYASAFADEKNAVTLLKQYTAWTPMKNRQTEYAALGLRAGYLTPTEAIERFELLSNGCFSAQQLETFARVLSADTSDEATACAIQFKEWLSQYTGTMTFDGQDRSLLTVEYKNGRPLVAVCDTDRDENADWQCSFDYGTPRQFTESATGVSVIYARYPFVTAMYTESESWELLPDVVAWPSVDVVAFTGLTAAAGGKEFYIPSVAYDGTMPGEDLFRKAAWRVTFDVPAPNALHTEFSLQDGEIISSVTVSGGIEQMTVLFENGIPAIRETDMNSDGFADITESFEVVEGEGTEEDQSYTEALYGPFTPAAVVRLAGVTIKSETLDIDSFEYVIAADGTETQYWDYQGDEVFSQKVISNADGSELTYSISDPLNGNLVLITTRSDNSVSVTLNGEDLPVAYDADLDFYWIGEAQDAVMRLQPIAQMLKDEVLEKAGDNPAAQSNVTVGGTVYVVSKNGPWVFGTRRLFDDSDAN